jgi:carboxymethylenebutenolidase
VDHPTSPLASAQTNAPTPARPRRLGLIAAAAAACGSVAFAFYSLHSFSEHLPPVPPAIAESPGDPGKQEEVFEGARQSMATFRSGGKDVRIERYLPIKEGKYPVILLLHGGGPANIAGTGLRPRARGFVHQGYVALIPRYLDQTATTFADPPTIDRNFVTWMGTVNSAIDYARGLPEVDPERVGLIGWSLGSALALEVAATNEHSTAVVGNIGGMAQEILNKMKRMPPTLLLDGEQDHNYPAHLARDLYTALKAKGVTVESKIYPGQGHGFSGEAAHDAWRRTDAFFAKYLAKKP